MSQSGSGAAKKGGGRKASTTVQSDDVCKSCGGLESKDGKGVDDKWVQCELCDKWHHINCVGLDDKDFEYLDRCKKAGKNIYWFCKDCNVSTIEMMKTVTEMKEKHDKLEMGLMEVKSDKVKLECNLEVVKADVSKEVNRLSGLIENVKHELVKSLEATRYDLNKAFEDKLPVAVAEASRIDDKSWVEVAGKHVDAKLNTVSTEIETMRQKLQESREAALEEQDKEKRRKNIIIYRVPETAGALNEERKVHDKKFCEQLLVKMDIGLAPEDITNTLRLGRRNEQATEPRPLLVQLGSRLAKNMLMESLYKLSSLEDKFKRIIVAHDMTQKERVECKALVAEAKRKTENSGEWNYKVRGPPGQMIIVSVRRRPQ